MPSLYLLGTGAGLSEPHRTTTMLALSSEESLILIDCGGDVVQRIFAAGLDLDRLSALILTHEHPDHVCGFPLLVQKIWLAGRRRPLPVYGPPEALAQARRCFAAFDTSRWEGLPEMQWHETTAGKMLDHPDWIVDAAPVDHSVPTLGLRIENLTSGGVVAYSCDTAPCEAVVTLAQKADILIHEATGEYPGHTSPTQAAQIAAKAEVGRLLLVHLPMNLSHEDLQAARAIFPNTEWGEELGRYEM